MNTRKNRWRPSRVLENTLLENTWSPTIRQLTVHTNINCRPNSYERCKYSTGKNAFDNEGKPTFPEHNVHQARDEQEHIHLDAYSQSKQNTAFQIQSIGSSRSTDNKAYRGHVQSHKKVLRQHDVCALVRDPVQDTVYPHVPAWIPNHLPHLCHKKNSEKYASRTKKLHYWASIATYIHVVPFALENLLYLLHVRAPVNLCIYHTHIHKFETLVFL
ncbi:hypothetical protein AYI68_g5717 [Smittium mucronatum]|uniref:Uncharacterized protein n=1 Tax=Smittium mucronatum TaxID=133383 RepID=A0A1R0GTM0_9FUNG|nr:hypothetical protein AYI68_g5717 [Smittium mucronatum]